MNKDQAVIVMAGCFLDLGKPKLESLVAHEKAGTPICCGPTAALLTDGAGAGCPSVLSCEAIVPMVKLEVVPDWDVAIKKEKRAKQWLSVWISLLSKDLHFTEALATADIEAVRKAIRIASLFAGAAPDGAGLIVPYINEAGAKVNLIVMQSEGRLRIFADAEESAT